MDIQQPQKFTWAFAEVSNQKHATRVQGCRPLSGETYSVEKAQEGVVFELATTSDKYPKTLRPMEALARDMKTQVHSVS